MKLVSWNLNGLEDLHLDARTEAAMFQILLGAPIEAVIKEGFKPNIPDVIVLQEVVERSYNAHIVPHLKRAGFSIFPQELPQRSYFEVVAVRGETIDAQYKSFEYSEQGRGLTTLNLNGLTVMTAHLESMPPGKEFREDQTKFIINKMLDIGPCIFAGDTNLRNEEWDSLGKGDIQDVWISAGSPKAHQMTWHYSNRKSRFDRAWTHKLDIQAFETFGKEKIPTTNARPSDHLGIRIEFDH